MPPAASLASLIGMRAPDVLYHLAAIPRGDVSSALLARSFVTNMAVLDAARVQLRAAQGRGHAAGDLAQVGRRVGTSRSRRFPIEPRGIRGVVERAVVDLLNAHRELDGVEFTALALSSVYGPRQRPEHGCGGRIPGGRRRQGHARDHRRRPPDPRLPVRRRRGRRDGRRRRRAGERVGRWMSGTGVQTTLRDLWQAISGSTGQQARFMPSTPDEITRFAVSPVRARIHLSWSPWTSLPEGLAQLR